MLNYWYPICKFSLNILYYHHFLSTSFIYKVQYGYCFPPQHSLPHYQSAHLFILLLKIIQWLSITFKLRCKFLGITHKLGHISVFFKTILASYFFYIIDTLEKSHFKSAYSFLVFTHAFLSASIF